MNTAGVADWITETTFQDIHRRARQWIAQKIVLGTKWADWNQSDIALDNTTGYPLYLAVNQAAGTFLVRDVKQHFPVGFYICLYDGDGVLDFSFDAIPVRRDAGRILLYANWTTGLNNGNDESLSYIH